jgi:hypothetical protein
MLGLTDNDFDDEVAALQAQVESMMQFDECKDQPGRVRKKRCYKRRSKDLSAMRKALSKAVKKRNSNKAMRLEKRKSKQYKNCFKAVGKGIKKAGKGYQRKSQGEADKILAEQGIDSQANRRAATMDGITGIVNSIAGIFGGGQGPGGGNPMAIILIVIAVGAAAYYFMNRKGEGNASSTS